MMRTPDSISRTAQVLGLTLLAGSVVLSAQGSRARDRTPPTAPTNLAVMATTEQSVTLAWGPSTDNSGSFNYIICCAGTTVTVPQTVTSHTLGGLQSGKTYVFRAYARDGAGNLSSSSNPVTVTLPGQIAAPTKPVVTLQDVGPTHVTPSWSSTDDGPLIWYTIHVDGEPVFSLNSRTLTLTCASVMVPTYCVPFDQDTTYTITVRARDVDGNLSPFSDPLVVTTDPADPNDHEPPTTPTNITGMSDGAFVIVQWDASMDNVTPQAFIRYDVYVNGELNRVVVGQTTADVEVYAGLNVITVVAVDTADNESAPGTMQ